jgi:endoglucanase
LWIKEPGSSDGTCGRGNPAAGTWWPDQAYELIAGASG